MSKIIELPYEIGTTVYALWGGGIEEAVIGHYVINKEYIYAMDSDDNLIQSIDMIYDDYEEASLKWEEWING